MEALIALSIVLLAVEALGRKGRQAGPALEPWKLCFAFGLLHGLGFAGALGSLGLPPQGTFWALLLFNLGLELGQLAVVLSALLLGRVLRDLVPEPSARLTPTALCPGQRGRVLVYRANCLHSYGLGSLT